MVNILVIPYRTNNQRNKIIRKNKGRYTDLDDCLMFEQYFDDEPRVGKLVWEYYDKN
jgi:hypothetical protein